MKMTVDKYLFIREMNEWDNERYSNPGLECLFEYCDEMYSDAYEFDPAEINQWASEYGRNCLCDWDDLVTDYGYIYPAGEYCEDHDIEKVIDESDYIDELLNVMSNKYIVLTASNGNAIIIE